MKKHSCYVNVSLITLLIIVMLMGCKNINTPQSTFDLRHFEDAMKNKGYSFEIIDVEEDFLPTTRKRMKFNYDVIDIYIFNGDKEMEVEAANIDKDGCGYTNGNKSLKVSWVSFPHFYKKGSLIVQYVGEDEKIISDLMDILGEQFAGYSGITVRNNDDTVKPDFPVPLGINANLSDEEIKGVLEYWKHDDEWILTMPSKNGDDNLWNIGIGPSYEFDLKIPYEYIGKTIVQAEDLAALNFASVEYWYYDGLSMVILSGFRGDEPNEPEYSVIQYISTIQPNIKTTRGIAIGDSVEKLKEAYPEAEKIKDYWSENNLDKGIPIHDSCYIYAPKGNNRSIMFLTKDDLIVQIDIGDGLDGQYMNPASPGFNKLNKEYYFEPNVSIIEGTLITRLHYGPPGYGEDPDNDEHEYPFILQLDDPIKVNTEDTDMINSSISDVLEVQLVLRGSPYVDMAKQYKNKRIKVQGSLFSAFTGHHHTKVLMVVDKILD